MPTMIECGVLGDTVEAASSRQATRQKSARFAYRASWCCSAAQMCFARTQVTMLFQNVSAFSITLELDTGACLLPLASTVASEWEIRDGGGEAYIR